LRSSSAIVAAISGSTSESGRFMAVVICRGPLKKGDLGAAPLARSAQDSDTTSVNGGAQYEHSERTGLPAAAITKRPRSQVHFRG
ncbi:MAG TPA: hypothetical protein VNI02_06160, partial [Blastocatellia bacterium]|nr:hypothetical protein [Blastocatellia bacterium]